MRGINTIESMVLKNVDEGFDLILSPGYINLFLKYADLLREFGVVLELFDFIGFYEINTFAVKIFFGSVPLFEYFQCFPIRIWILILISILIISLLSKISRVDTKLKSIEYYIWNFTIFLISGSMNKFIVRSVPHLLLYAWLIFVLMISIQFTAYLLDFMAKTVPMIKINSFDELLLRKDLKIIIRSDSDFVMDSNTDNDLSKQFDTYFDYEPENISQKLLTQLPNGSAAFVNDRLILLFTLIDLFKSENISLDFLHISRDKIEYQPYFIAIKQGTDEWATKALKQTIVSCRESGLYDKWNQDVLNRMGNSNSMLSEERKDELCSYSELTIEQINDIFYIFIIQIILSIIIFIFEIIVFYNRYILATFDGLIIKLMRIINCIYTQIPVVSHSIISRLVQFHN